MLRKYLQALNPALVGLIGVFAYWATNGSLDKAGLAVVVVTAVQVTGSFLVANVPGWTWLKALVPPILANIGVVGLWIETGFDRVEAIAFGTTIVLALVSLFSPSAPSQPSVPSDAGKEPVQPLGMQPRHP